MLPSSVDLCCISLHSNKTGIHQTGPGARLSLGSQSVGDADAVIRLTTIATTWPDPRAQAGIIRSGWSWNQGFNYRPVRPNRCCPVPVYRSGLAGNLSVPVEFKFEFKWCNSTGSYRYTGWLDWFIGRFGRFIVDLMIFSDG